MNLSSYLQRVRIDSPLRVDLDSLERIHLAHATHIPFENLDIQLGRTISLELEALQRKMIDNERGGYCFEQNTLLQAALSDIGFDVIACEARVRMGRKITTPRTHMLLIVKIADQPFLVDAGFGGDGLLRPVPIDGREHKQFLWTYRVIQEEEINVLQILRTEGWFDLYAFRPESRYPVDFEVANWYTCAHPESRFVQTLTVQLPTPEARYILRNTTFSIEREGLETREISSSEELLEVLRTSFGLNFPAETKFKNPKF